MERLITNATTKKREARRWTPRPLLLPEDEVAYEPPEDMPAEIQEYLRAYARTGSRSGACRLIGRSTRWAYRRAEELGERLTEEENKAYQGIIERIEATMTSRALEEPGMPGVTSGIFLLKAAYPERFAERKELKHAGNVVVDWVSFMRGGIDNENGD